MKLPSRTHVCWQSPEWRTTALRQIMEERGLTASMAAEILEVTEQTIFNWRASVARPISAHALKALVFEVERESLV